MLVLFVKSLQVSEFGVGLYFPLGFDDSLEARRQDILRFLEDFEFTFADGIEKESECRVVLLTRHFLEDLLFHLHNQVAIRFPFLSEGEGAVFVFQILMNLMEVRPVQNRRRNQKVFGSVESSVEVAFDFLPSQSETQRAIRTDRIVSPAIRLVKSASNICIFVRGVEFERIRERIEFLLRFAAYVARVIRAKSSRLVVAVITPGRVF